MKPHKNGVTVEELLDDGSPYKLWQADQWICTDCGTTVITGFSSRPFAEHYQSNYAAVRESHDDVIAGRCR